MFDMGEATDMVRSTFAFLLGYAEKTGRPFSEVAREYPILLRPMPTDVTDMIRYVESLARLFGDLATFYSGPPVFEGERESEKALDFEIFFREGLCHVTRRGVGSEFVFDKRK
jgi:hypothetical protein